jgi:CRISPR/Cas system-associated exonuclease Cas4 (RecB family)
MDAAVGLEQSAGQVPRVVDYKYASWRLGAEADYEMQMTAYALALMKALRSERALSELWYLKPPLRIIRREYARDEAEDRLKTLLGEYNQAVRNDAWPAAERAYCDKVECGFRERCWSAT